MKLLTDAVNFLLKHHVATNLDPASVKQAETHLGNVAKVGKSLAGEAVAILGELKPGDPVGTAAALAKDMLDDGPLRQAIEEIVKDIVKKQPSVLVPSPFGQPGTRSTTPYIVPGTVTINSPVISTPIAVMGTSTAPANDGISPQPGNVSSGAPSAS